MEIKVEKLLNTPQGESLLLSEAAKHLQDAAMAELAEQYAQGLIQQDGTPTDALQGKGEITGISLPNAARSQLGGIVAGAMGTQNMVRDADALAGIGV